MLWSKHGWSLAASVRKPNRSRLWKCGMEQPVEHVPKETRSTHHRVRKARINQPYLDGFIHVYTSTTHSCFTNITILLFHIIPVQLLTWMVRTIIYHHIGNCLLTWYITIVPIIVPYYILGYSPNITKQSCSTAILPLTSKQHAEL